MIGQQQTHGSGLGVDIPQDLRCRRATGDALTFIAMAP
jgi:hypothetical protein